MLIESNPLLEATSFGREREVRKHVGDYTLFVTGLFPESVARASRGNRPQLRTQRGGIMATGTVIYKCSREKRRIGRPNLVQNFCKQVTHLGLAFGLRLGKPAGRQRRHHGHARPPRAPRPRACHRSIITEVPPIYTLPLTFFTKKKLFALSICTSHIKVFRHKRTSQPNGPSVPAREHRRQMNRLLGTLAALPEITEDKEPPSELARPHYLCAVVTDAGAPFSEAR